MACASTLARTLAWAGLSLTLGAVSALVHAQAPTQTQTPAQAHSPVGLWKTLDDETRKPKAIIRLSERDGVISGRIEKILTDQAGAVCEKCPDERKNQPVLGMTILTGMRREGDRWDGGRILDPNNGKIYNSQLRLIDQGRRLELRGYVGTPMIGRTQVWHREDQEATVQGSRP